MNSLVDDEFGAIKLRHIRGAKSIRISVGTDGRLVVTAPHFTPTIAIKAFIATSRAQIRALFQGSAPKQPYTNGQIIGKSHRLVVVPSNNQPMSIKTRGLNILVRLPEGTSLNTPAVQREIRDVVITALRKEAKAHLPKRLEYLAHSHDFSYTKLRFSHAGTRWGSCSSNGTISLNIALMKLPNELIDYVLAHELAHTRQMNHSNQFWKIVESVDPLYRLHRRQLKQYTPTV